MCDNLRQFRSIQDTFTQIQAENVATMAVLHSKMDMLHLKFDDILRAIKEYYGPSEPISMVADQLLASNDPDPRAETTADNLQPMVEASNSTTSLAVTAQEQVNEDPNSAITTVNPTIEGLCGVKVLRTEENDGPVFGKIVVQDGASKLFAKMSESIEGKKVAHYMFDETPKLFSVDSRGEICARFSSSRIEILESHLFEKMPELTSAVQNKRADVHGELVHKLVEDIKAKGVGTVTRESGPAKGGNSVIAFAKDPDGYLFELIQCGPTPEPLCQVMLRVGDLDRSIKFYETALGM